MDLDFPVIVRLARHLIRDVLELNRSVTDSEIAALQCAWDSIEHKDFEKNTTKFTQRYRECYRFPDKTKKVATLASNSSRILRAFASYYFASSDQKINRHNFRRKITELFENGTLNIADFSDIYDEFQPDVNESTQARIIEEEKIDLNKDSIIANESTVDFIGREKDNQEILNRLEKYYITALYGASGVGKTTLTRKIIDDLKSNYSIFYTDLRYIKDFTQWGYNIISQAKTNSYTSEENLSGKLIELLNHRHSLVVIDSVSWMSDEMKAFLESYPLQDNSLSSFLLVSQKKIYFDIDDSKLSYYHLKGLNSKENIYEFFSKLGLKKSDKWEEMSEFYQGNFREIIYVSKFIKDYFEGDVSLYWQTESRILSPEIIKNFASLNFTPVDRSIFSMFLGEENIISTNIIKSLRSDSRTAEIFARINFLSDYGFLIQSKNGPNTSFKIAPLLKEYLIQKGIVGDQT